MAKRKPEREVSAGGIVFRRFGPEARFLLIKDSYRHWGFPKGHLEEEETPAEAALRETGEETGLEYAGCSTARSGSSTGISGFAGAPSTSSATSSSSRVPRARSIPQEDEGITDHQWLPLDKALEQLSYDNARGVLRRAGEMARTLVAVGAGRPTKQPDPVAAEG